MREVSRVQEYGRSITSSPITKGGSHMLANLLPICGLPSPRTSRRPGNAFRQPGHRASQRDDLQGGEVVSRASELTDQLGRCRTDDDTAVAGAGTSHPLGTEGALAAGSLTAPVAVRRRHPKVQRLIMKVVSTRLPSRSACQPLGASTTSGRLHTGLRTARPFAGERGEWVS